MNTTNTSRKEKPEVKQDKYFLPEDYRERELRTTMAEVSGADYWTPERIHYSGLYQYHVYKFASYIIKKYGLKSLVDVGCGPASKLVRIHKDNPSLAIIGIDQIDGISLCKKRHSFGDWFVDDFENPDQNLPQNKGDLVVCADVIEHVLDPDKLLSYCHSRMNEGGYILISTPDRERLYGSGALEPKNKDHVREWTSTEFKDYLESRGYRVLEQFHQIGVKPGLNKLYARVLVDRFLRGSPKSLLYNQVVLIQSK